MLVLYRSNDTRSPYLTEDSINAFIKEMDKYLKFWLERLYRCFITTIDLLVGTRFRCSLDGLYVSDRIFVIFRV
jgi:hypothetical protein